MHGPTKPPQDVSPVSWKMYLFKYWGFGKFRWYGTIARTIHGTGISIYIWLILMVNAGNYTSPMDPTGCWFNSWQFKYAQHGTLTPKSDKFKLKLKFDPSFDSQEGCKSGSDIAGLVLAWSAGLHRAIQTLIIMMQNLQKVRGSSTTNQAVWKVTLPPKSWWAEAFHGFGFFPGWPELV